MLHVLDIPGSGAGREQSGTGRMNCDLRQSANIVICRVPHFPIYISYLF